MNPLVILGKTVHPTTLASQLSHAACLQLDFRADAITV